MTLIVHAPNVHQGGGRTLLLALLEAAARRGGAVALIDARLHPSPTDGSAMVALGVGPTLLGRLAAERRLASLARSGDTVLCFGNLPPLWDVAGRVHLLLQNRYLLRARDLSRFPASTRLRIAVERQWLRARILRVDRIIVQTASMAREVKAALGREATVLPFAPGNSDQESEGGPRVGTFDFVYVASGEPHKNHERLLEAWALLAGEGLTPSLALTLDPAAHPELRRRVEHDAQRHGTRVSLTGMARPEHLYRSAGALIYPSLFESLGLPLVEARRHGLPIVAAERDYVRDVVDPEQSFDPESAVSIARAVRRHLGREGPKAAILSPAEFLESLLSA